MNVWKPIAIVAVAGLAVSLGTQIAGAAVPHPNLNKTLEDETNAILHLADAQRANEFDLGGHAQNAINLVKQAKEETQQAIRAANGNGK